jgi:16S rRNA (guanine527-N7)-methyltransferase
MRSLELELRQGLEGLSLVLEDAQTDRLLSYLDLVQKWTKVYNLTAIRTPQEMLTHHLLDSLAVVNPLRLKLASPGFGVVAGETAVQASRARLLDVGSGAGLPGVIVAICCPELVVDCVDAVGKKAAFVQQVALALSLPNLRGLHARAESLTDKYAAISSRAFASLSDFVAVSEAALAADGIWMAMKGKQPLDEIAALPTHVQVFHVEQLTVPLLGAERCIVWMRKT